MIKENENHFPVRMMCRVLRVSHSGYYDWRDRKPSVRSKENAKLSERIKEVFDAEKRRSGAKRIAKLLSTQDSPVGRHRVAKIMRLNGWRARAAKKYKATTNSNHSLPVAPNLLQQDFLASKPDEKWVSDITYVWTE